MDSSRDADLQALHARFHDSDRPLWQRQKAYRMFQEIQSQVKDRKLVGLRHRLIAALVAKDEYEAEKIELQIKEYRYRSGHTPRLAESLQLTA